MKILSSVISASAKLWRVNPARAYRTIVPVFGHNPELEIRSNQYGWSDHGGLLTVVVVVSCLLWPVGCSWFVPGLCSVCGVVAGWQFSSVLVLCCVDSLVGRKQSS